MNTLISREALAAANKHAVEEYPNESCGLLVDGVYRPCFNYSTTPKIDFAIASEIWKRLTDAGSKIEAVVHSHPDGPIYPSERDMQGQVDTDLPWIIIPTDGTDCAAPTVWGHEIAPIIGRTFIHGVTDCYSLIEDVFCLGKDALAEQGVVWPFAPIKLLAFPRNDGWWNQTEYHQGDDLYMNGFAKAGFKEIARHDAAPGDVFLTSIRSKQLNHGGVLLGDGTICHHLPLRLSRREPAGIWANAADLWLRKTDAAA